MTVDSGTLFKNKRILTVDDSAMTRYFLRRLLTLQGATVEEAASGQEVLEHYQANQRYDVILLDLQLPDMDGLRLLQQLRATDEQSTIILLTGQGDVKTATLAVRQGADGYIAKQHIFVGEGNYSEFFYALEQALLHRANLVAQKQLESIKADFYSMLTHELRNPASTILFATQMLLEEGGEPLSEGQRELIEMIHELTHKFHTLINDYLEFAQIDAGHHPFEFASVELASLIKLSITLVSQDHPLYERALQVELPQESLQAQVDAERITQLLNHLLVNAIHNTARGGLIQVTLQPDNEHALLIVTDDGPKLSPQELPFLFQPPTTTAEMGRGLSGPILGYLLAREIAEGHGGSIEAQGQEASSRGNRILVRLPLTLPSDL